MKRLPLATPMATRQVRNRTLVPKKAQTHGQEIEKEEKSKREKLLDALIQAAGEITGTKHESVSDRITCQVGYVLDSVGRRDEPSADSKIILALELIKELAPQDATQSMLAAQMIACHNATMRFVALALVPEQPSQHVESNIGRASKLMNVFTAQVELMQKLKGKGAQQKVTVEHVHVYPGGQAIVGVSGGTGG
jgi:hypothetical protein